jgi:hypothetical protein
LVEKPWRYTFSRAVIRRSLRQSGFDHDCIKSVDGLAGSMTLRGLDDASQLGRLAEVQRTVLMNANRPALADRYRSGIA